MFPLHDLLAAPKRHPFFRFDDVSVVPGYPVDNAKPHYRQCGAAKMPGAVHFPRNFGFEAGWLPQEAIIVAETGRQRLRA